MFAKLLKYEFKSTGRSLAFASLAALIAGAIGGGLLYVVCDGYLLQDLDVLLTVAIILLGGIFLGLMCYAIGSIFTLYARFYKNKFCDEGYLTFTLPASTHQILLASMLNIVIWSVIVTLVTLLSYAMILAGIAGLSIDLSEPIYILQDVIEPDGYSLFQLVLSALSSAVYSLVLPLVSLTIGCLIAKKHKILCSFAIGYAISIAVSLFTGAVTATAFLQESIGMDIADPYGTAFLWQSLLQLALGIGGYFLMHHLIKKHLNI